jgi:ribosome biogenesis GTP-binding protein YsxC/EngB
VTQQKQLAFASKKPGRTQHINLFALGKQGVTDAVLADLPGYGYAAVSRTDKERWQRVMLNYLMSRESLSAVVLLCDPRLGLTELDEALLDAIRPRVEQGLKFLIVLTKADKLTRAEQAKILSITKLNAGGGEVRLFSALKSRAWTTWPSCCGTGATPRLPQAGRPRRECPGGSRHPSDARRRDTCAKSAIGAYLASARSYKKESFMVMTCTHTLSTGVELECRTSGEPGQPLLLFLHGFPEGAFIWDGLLEHRQPLPLRGAQSARLWPLQPTHGHQRLPCQIPGGGSCRLIALESPAKRAACVIAHDWGGAVAWGLANRYPQQLERLLILNSPHPGSFLRELQSNPVQQSASQYMHFLRRPDAPELLAENGWQRMLGFFQNPDGSMPAWLTPERQQQYREHWIWAHGACMFYAASPLVPPRPGGSADELQDIRELSLPDEMLHIPVPVRILWGDSDCSPPCCMGWSMGAAAGDRASARLQPLGGP